jgi:hypothetical protein
MLYPGLDLSREFHEDHVFPRSRFTTKRLASAGISQEVIGDYRQKVDLLPNLQLLAGVPNMRRKRRSLRSGSRPPFPPLKPACTTCGRTTFMTFPYR